MARCYHCGKVLEDAWLKRQGAALMGKTSGEKKARTPEQARRAAHARWGKTEIQLNPKVQLKSNEPQSLEEELAQEKHRRKFVTPLKKPRRKKKT